MAHGSAKPPTKVVVRRLPAALPETIFRGTIEVWLPLTDYYFYRQGKGRAKNPVASVAFMNFKEAQQANEFMNHFHGHVFVDSKGKEDRAEVDFALYQKVPKVKKREDSRQGTIEKDPEYLAFVEKLKNPVVEHLPSAEVQLEKRLLEEKEKLVTTGGVPANAITPLIADLRAKKMKKFQKQAERRTKREDRQRGGGKRSKENSKRGGVVPSTPSATSQAAAEGGERRRPGRKRDGKKRREEKLAAAAAAGGGAGAAGAPDPNAKKPRNRRGKERGEGRGGGGGSGGGRGGGGGGGWKKKGAAQQLEPGSIQIQKKPADGATPASAAQAPAPQPTHSSENHSSSVPPRLQNQKRGGGGGGGRGGGRGGRGRGGGSQATASSAAAAAAAAAAASSSSPQQPAV